MSIANLALRFTTEMAGIAAGAYAGFQVAAPLPVRVAVGLGAAIGAIAAWAALVAPSNANGIPPLTKDLIGSVILLGTAGALAWAGQPQLAIGFAAVVVLNTALLVVLGTDVRDQLAGASR